MFRADDIQGDCQTTSGYLSSLCKELALTVNSGYRAGHVNADLINMPGPRIRSMGEVRSLLSSDITMSPGPARHYLKY